MKFMRIGTRPDNFYTQQAVRTTLSDLPSDLTICVNNVTYLLHKFPLLPKCGLLQRLCSDSSRFCVELHDIPGGEDAFELCAKFCYGVTIDLSAHNFVQAISAAKFLQMTESIDKGNFVSKLEAFFNSCILQGWKDSIVTLHTTGTLPEWSENLGIIRKCIDSIVDKIVTPPSKVKWSYTYTRQGYARKKAGPPKDWWTEDIAKLDIDLFRCIINSVKLSNKLSPQLIGEALHVYSCLWLPKSSRRLDPETSSTSTVNKKKRQLLETIISMIPEDKGSVSTGFLLRLLSLAKLLRVTTVMEAQLIKKCSLQLEDATPNDLLLLSSIDLVKAVVDSFMLRWTGPNGLVTKVGQVVDSYLQIVARDANMPLHKLVSLAKALPRPQHDSLYKAINIYLKEHPKTTKEEKKQLCSVIDCQKLSAEVCAHVVKNSRLPLRMVVQALFFEQDGKPTATNESKLHSQPYNRHKSNLQVGSGEESSVAHSARQKLQPESKHKSMRKKVVENGREILMDSRNTRIQTNRSEHGHNSKDR